MKVLVVLGDEEGKMYRYCVCYMRMCVLKKRLWCSSDEAQSHDLWVRVCTPVHCGARASHTGGI